MEIFRHLPPSQNGDVILALRTEHEVYVEYRSGPRELYDLRTDPYQLQNVYATADPAISRNSRSGSRNWPSPASPSRAV